jgi:outer membrane protein assembly factor BamB
MSTCAVHDGLCYACDIAGYFHCLDAKTGEKLWMHDLRASVWPGGPFWVDGKVYVGTEDGEVWVFKHGRERRVLSVVDVGKPVRAPLAAANGVLYVASESHLLAVGWR